ncbi:MAG: hypothetical protein ACYCS1_04305 [Gammaproteobacteria bacterium]
MVIKRIRKSKKLIKFNPKTVEELNQNLIEINQYATDAKTKEMILKTKYKQLIKDAKSLRSDIAQTTNERKFYQKELLDLGKRFKQKYYIHRKWSAENPLLALEKSIEIRNKEIEKKNQNIEKMMLDDDYGKNK